MAAKNVDIKINTTASGTGAKQTAADMDKLAASSTKAAAATNTVTTSTSKLGARAGAIGLQMQDVAVQAQMGTSAVTILAQQGTQIASIFGPQGAIVGALIGVGAVAAKVFYDMAVAAAVTGEAMEDVGETIKEAFSQNTTREIEDFNKSLSSQSQFAETLRQAEYSLYEARNLRAEADARLIGLQLKLDEASINYLSSTGQIVDKEKALLAVRTQAAEAEKKASIEAELARVENARKKYNFFVAQTDSVLADQAKAEKRLAELEARQAQLSSDVTFRRGQDQAAIKAGAQKEDYVNPQTTLIEEQLNAVTKQIQDVNNTLRKIPDRINEISQGSIAVATEVDLAIQESQTKINEINQKFNLTAKAQALGAATESITKGAAEIFKRVDEIEAITPLEQQAKEAIKQATGDLKITATEQSAISANLKILTGSLKTGQEENLKTLRDLLTINDTIGTKMQQMSNEISGLKQKINNITVR